MTIKSASRRKIRYGVVGLGHIAQTAMLPAFRHARENSELCALYSGDPVKLEKLGKKYRIDQLYSYEQFEESLSRGDVDAIYIATPNNKHKDFVQTAARHRVHVICEKPMELDEVRCQAMIDSAEAHRIKLMIAYRLHFETANLQAIEIARSRRLGDLKIFSSIFTMQLKDATNIRLQPEMGGGPLYDIGIYCINAARNLFHQEPCEVFAMTSETGDPRFKDVHEMMSCTLRFPKGELATFTVSFGAAESSAYDLIGTKGRIHIENGYDYANPMELHITRDEKTKKKRFKKKDQFASELVYFSNCILNNIKPEPSGLEGLADVRVIEALYRSLRESRPVQLNPQDAPVKAKWPNIEQRIEKPALPKTPEAIHAKEP